MSMRPFLAILVLALALVACGGDDSGDDVAVTSTTTTEATATSSTTSSTTSTTEPEVEVASRETYGEAAEAWVDAIAEGDLDRAWELTAPASQEAVGGRQAFDEMEIELAEGWAAWGRAEDVAFRTVILEEDGDQFAVVLLDGTVAQEGPPEEAFAALPVRWDGTSALVDPFVDVGDVELQPPTGSELGPDDSLRAIVPTGTEVRFVLDDGAAGPSDEPPTSSEATGDGRQQAIYEPGTPLSPGRHTLAVVVTSGDDVTVRTAEYVVAG